MRPALPRSESCASIPAAASSSSSSSSESLMAMPKASAFTFGGAAASCARRSGDAAGLARRGLAARRGERAAAAAARSTLADTRGNTAVVTAGDERGGAAAAVGAGARRGEHAAAARTTAAAARLVRRITPDAAAEVCGRRRCAGIDLRARAFVSADAVCGRNLRGGEAGTRRLPAAVSALTRARMPRGFFLPIFARALRRLSFCRFSTPAVPLSSRVESVERTPRPRIFHLFTRLDSVDCRQSTACKMN